MDINLAVIVSFFVSLVSALIITPKLRRMFLDRKIVGRDVHKTYFKNVAEMGGIPIVLGFSFGTFTFVAMMTFLNEEAMLSWTPLFGAICSIFLVFVIGVMDDLLDIRWRTKAFLPLIAAIPLMAVKAGTTVMNIPAIGQVDFGVWYALLLVPIGFTGATNAVNMLAGYNGLEAGLSALIMGTLLAIAYKAGAWDAVVLLAVMLGVMLAFLVYNWFPAKIFPGDSGTLPMGAVIASAVILGNMERAGMLLFGLYFINLGLLFMRMFKKKKQVKFGGVGKDGVLTAPHPYNLHYFMIRLMRPTERGLVVTILALQVVICAAVLIMTFWL
jgi:UDP-N-acetylglucosamine--dolichyl-phosphate N-acetylglucosaminephosphotransferase